MSAPELPHGPGFTWIHEVEIDREGACARAKTVLDPSLPVFADHFPGRALFPGVLLVECGAQAAGCLWSELLGLREPQPLLLAQILGFQFKRAALPGQTLIVEVKRERLYGRLAEFSVSIRESDEPVAGGRILLALADANGR
ncbi:3-hydroxyacyl-ACP dehydratase FabZ family protein [Methylacidimicrobium sp. B4]|uniref:3-hydroxyacyl-ACP dehydratase FabZ family protein n=1 Tax=Methylacidimicrobium sp. B4 TaxID=2796139 RepID=UPI001A8CD2E9|nr:3-hydroxyacyl-ACP dehydratase FabZ family protein [Methylacidimicrobium sp. B4]QSR85112.1 beta-hydroxyacyl-ACP dehydratase [Methylacidimicrobium sp. B4]